MKLVLLFSLFISSMVYAADVERHRIVKQRLDGYENALKSVQPNKAIVYFSSSLNVDAIDTAEVVIDSFDISDGNIEITRPISTDDGNITIQQVTRCEADFGEVEIQPNKLIVFTERLPVTVFCTDDNSEYREAYGTIEKF